MTLKKTLSTLLGNFEETLIDHDYFLTALSERNLLSFEDKLHLLLQDLYNDLAQMLLEYFSSSAQFKAIATSYCCAKGVGKLKKRKTTLQLRTGRIIEFKNDYLGKVGKPYKGSRHLFHIIFGTIGKASPSYYSTIALFSVVCPSFEVSGKLLKSQHISSNCSRIRDLALQMGKKCLANRVGLQLSKGENVTGKKVVVSIDGGRTRIRHNKKEKNAKGTHCLYETRWQEPKLFVIHIIDPITGKQSKEALPIYDGCFDKEECFALLGAYLTKIGIEKAEKVQFIADGAIWIWKRAKNLLLNLGVKEENIVETLDYYHGIEHLSEIIKNLPKKVSKPTKKKLYQELKRCLNNGEITQITAKVKQVATRINAAIRKELKYFTKHINRCQYAEFRDNKLLCGSGIMESAIRRIINLRFKSASSFWYKNNVEALLFLRATFLSDRWSILINNIIKIKN